MTAQYNVETALVSDLFHVPGKEIDAGHIQNFSLSVQIENKIGECPLGNHQCDFFPLAQHSRHDSPFAAGIGGEYTGGKFRRSSGNFLPTQIKGPAGRQKSLVGVSVLLRNRNARRRKEDFSVQSFQGKRRDLNRRNGKVQTLPTVLRADAGIELKIHLEITAMREFEVVNRQIGLGINCRAHREIGRGFEIFQGRVTGKNGNFRTDFADARNGTHTEMRCPALDRTAQRKGFQCNRRKQFVAARNIQAQRRRPVDAERQFVTLARPDRQKPARLFSVKANVRHRDDTHHSGKSGCIRPGEHHRRKRRRQFQALAPDNRRVKGLAHGNNGVRPHLEENARTRTPHAPIAHLRAVHTDNIALAQDLENNRLEVSLKHAHRRASVVKRLPIVNKNGLVERCRIKKLLALFRRTYERLVLRRHRTLRPE